jgi:acetyl-CoA carboxylase biotin carboxyl carrier protein
MIDIELLKRLIRLVEESGIDSLEVERFATRIRIRKSPMVSGGGAVVATHAHAVPAIAPVDATPAPATASEESPPAGPAATGFHEIHSPMVGTFYRAPSPDADPYVDVGDNISKGQTLCILEAMKLMNELESEIDGVIREVAVQDAEPVEYGQVLFLVEPA